MNKSITIKCYCRNEDSITLPLYYFEYDCQTLNLHVFKFMMISYALKCNVQCIMNVHFINCIKYKVLRVKFN